MTDSAPAPPNGNGDVPVPVGLLDGSGDRVFVFDVPRGDVVVPKKGHKHEGKDCVKYSVLLDLVERCSHFQDNF